MSEVKFAKWQGLGNDFIIWHPEAMPDTALAGELAKRWCDRHFGIGADGLIAALPGKPGESQLTMEIFNADGSVAAMCGNGIRCLAAWAVQSGLVTGSRLAISTRSGLKEITVSPGRDKAGWEAEVDMGPPSVLEEAQPATVAGRALPAYIISMGNLHRVVLHDVGAEAGTAWLRQLDVPALGRSLDKSSHGDCNVEFVVPLGERELSMRVCERGVGETLACGTGACAVLVAASLHGLCPREAVIHLAGGDLAIRWEEHGRVVMRGPASETFRGVLTEPLL